MRRRTISTLSADMVASIAQAPCGNLVGMSRRISGGVERLTQAPAATAVKGSLRRRLERLQAAWLGIVQTGVAAGLAWFLAKLIVGQSRPFFAPVSAVISLGLAHGKSWRRAVELSLGVAVGILVADVIGRVIGHGAWQIGLVVALTMAAALLVGAGTILVNQAAVSAILVMTLPAGQGPVGYRFLDALIGGAVAVVIGQAVLRRDPLAGVARAAKPLLEELAASQEETAAALTSRDLAAAEKALIRARGIDEELTGFYDALAVARESAWLLPRHHPRRGHLRDYADAARQVDYAVRNTRQLARSAVRAVRTGAPVDPTLPDSILTLAAAVRKLAEELGGPEPAFETRALALDAAALAMGVLERHRDLATSMIVGQVRATAFDLLRGSGLSIDEARETIDAQG
jgi:uncharacterized membrane protein YgaE (UPF0421/DUF939 family)